MRELTMLPEFDNFEVKNRWQKVHIDRFLKSGWPSSKNEEWKFTSLHHLVHKPFKIGLNLNGIVESKSAPSIKGANQLLFRNGILDSQLSEVDSDDLVINNLLDNPSASVFLNQTKLKQHPVYNLTLGAMQSATVIDIDNASSKQTPLIELFFTGGLIKQSSHPVVVVRLAKNSKVNILETHSSYNGLSAPIIFIELGEGSVCNHVKCQVADLDSIQLGLTLINQEKDSDYRNFTLSSGGCISRSELHLNLNGEEATCHLSAIYLGCKQQHMDVTSRLYHNVANCKSEQIIRGVLDDRARGIFQGKIRVAPEAQKTDGQQMTRALLLSRETEADTKPELEIFADDVICTHGATVGELDENQLFYLVSRGIPSIKARAMLIEAFLIDTLSQIRAPELKKQAEYYIQDWVSKSTKLSSSTG